MPLRRFKDISNPPNNSQIFRLLWIDLQFFADTTDVYHDGIFHGVGIAFPDSFVNFLCRVHPPRIGHQHLQNFELRCSKSNRFSPDDKLLLGGVQYDIADLNLIFGFGFPEGIPATVRRTLGGDIDASCGQLRRKYTKEQK